MVTRHLQRHRDEGANPWSSRDDDHFSILLWVHLRGAFILKHTDNVSHALQGSSMSAAQGQQVAEEVCKTLSRDRFFPFDLSSKVLIKMFQKIKTIFITLDIAVLFSEANFHFHIFFMDVRANCFCAPLLCTQIHTPRHACGR